MRVWLGAICGLVTVLGISEEANADGVLEINNIVEGFGSADTLGIIRCDIPTASDGFDSIDALFPGIIENRSGIYSDLSKIGQGNYGLKKEYRLNSSTSTYFIELGFNGAIEWNTGNHLQLAMPITGWTFGVQPITIQQSDSNGDRYGRLYNVRDIVANQSGRLTLPDIAAGGYSGDVPYKMLLLDFQPITVTIPDGVNRVISNDGLQANVLALQGNSSLRADWIIADTLTIGSTSLATVPEPSTAILLCIGAVSLLAITRRRR
jgi:hypothetical protein